MITVYQLDDDLALYGGARQAPTKGDRQVLVKPPAIPDGHVAKWVTELHHVTDTPNYGEEGTGSWEVVEDHRKDKLYTEDGEYKIGDDYEGQSYDGLGPIPAWLSTEAPEQPVEPDPVPYSVTRAQGKAALIQAGLWPDVLAFVDGITDPTEKALADVALNDTQDWRRDSPFLNQAALAVGLSEEQLDDLFTAAAQIAL